MAEKFRRYRALIFDYDDTLVNTFKVRRKALQECGKKFFHKKISTILIRTLWGTPFQDFLPIIMGPNQTYETVAPKYFEIAAKYPLHLIPDVLPTLELLSREYLLGIVSSSNKEILDFDFKRLGLKPELFFAIQTAEQTKHHKPDPRVFIPILRRLYRANVHPKEVLYIGDSFYDQKAAQATGFGFLGVTTGLVTYKEFYKSFTDAVKKFSQIPQFLEEANND